MYIPKIKSLALTPDSDISVTVALTLNVPFALLAAVKLPLWSIFPPVVSQDIFPVSIRLPYWSMPIAVNFWHSSG